MKYRKAIFVVTYAKVKDEIYYLILKRKLHWKGWEFPKGGLESLREKLFVNSAVKREVKEETSLKAIKIKNMKTSGKYKYNLSKKQIFSKHFIMVCFSGHSWGLLYKRGLSLVRYYCSNREIDENDTCIDR